MPIIFSVDGQLSATNSIRMLMLVAILGTIVIPPPGVMDFHFGALGWVGLGWFGLG